ncbi:N-acetyltransferase [Pantoea ananatis]|uniref:GNAT family N-acetyltransferase n=1 Tax=Pantoea ananas TaxID=553 RepID=UPI000B7E153B|nr:GNAT family N-acetyltransferase [Pantoea ananatis]AWQ20626.1 N-acetyltransferase [Pantoea ananatis]
MLKVRKALPEDYSAWLTLWKGYLHFYGQNLDDAVTLSTWQRIQSPESALMCWLAEFDGKVTGFVVCVIHEGTWFTQPVCYLEDLFVEENARGVGAGKALITRVCDEAREAGWAKVYWVTNENNPARKLYDKLAQVDDVVRYNIRF